MKIKKLLRSMVGAVGIMTGVAGFIFMMNHYGLYMFCVLIFAGLTWIIYEGAI